ncbi:pre-mRNA-splicing factor CWC25 protein [Trifolium repens]|nr:pre-mRNA-splicing factor CWC25 protein [Trifolium repens]
MALKFLNKKGWHTGSLRNIENVWKAEQKHNAEEKKLDELRKQIQEERERSEFRLLQEKAGLVPHQERLEFLYDSGLSVGKTSEGFKALEALPKSDATDAPSSSSASKEASVPGALFEDKPQSANDAWRKLHSDPLLMIRQREQEALAKIKNNPVKMAMIRKSVEEKEHKKKDKKKKHRSSKSKHKIGSDSEDDIGERRKRKASDEDFDKKRHKAQSDSENESSDEERKRRKSHYDDKKYREGSPSHHRSQSKVKDYKEDADNRRKNHYEDKKYRERSPSHHQSRSKVRDYKEDADDRHDNKSKSGRYAPEGQSNFDVSKRGNRSFREPSSTRSSGNSLERESHYKRRNVAPKLSEEERAAKLKQMQLAAELHEGERWKRIKKAEETDAQEAIQNTSSVGKNFLDTAQKSIYGAAEGGSASIAESIQRRTHYSQGRSGGEGNAFRR